jgi:hypothetical protein
MTVVSSTGRRLAGAFLIFVMAAGSIAMWLGIPIGLIYAASRVNSDGDPSMGVYVALAILIPALMFTAARLLGRVDKLYADIMRQGQDKPQQPKWMRSMRGERGSTHKTTVLDVVMVLSVGVALLAMAVWFFAFAGSSLPGG